MREVKARQFVHLRYIIMAKSHIHRRKIMQSRRIIISAAGVLLFLLAGGIAMFVLPSESPNPPAKNQPQSSVNHQTSSQNYASSVNQQAAPQKYASSQIQQSPQEPPHPAEPKVWYVYVTGEVHNEGLYAVSPDSRVFQAIEAAGGFTRKADRTSLNLAAHLVDETHIHVPAKGSQKSGTAPHAAPPQTVRIPGYSQQTSSSGGLIDINRADLQGLQRISGVGPAIAQRIIDYRNTHGAFTSIEDLQKVRGIGTKTMERIRPQVTVQGGAAYTSGTTYSQKSQTSSGNSSLIDINHASQAELERISGVGAKTAQRIIEYRHKHGSFSRVEDLLHVRGIGASKLEQIRSQVVIR